MKKNMSRAELEARFDEIRAREPETLTAQEAVSLAEAEAMDDGTSVSLEDFKRDLEDYSSGQRKKVLLAASLCDRAHLYVWDEPLNFIDVISRMQVEDLLLACRPTLLFVEHDARFCQEIATRRIQVTRV